MVRRRHYLRMPADLAILRDLRDYVRSCCAREVPPRVSEFADHIGVSRTQVTRAVFRVTGQTAAAVIRRLQVGIAQELICAGLPLKQVAYRAGFGTRRTFFRVFHRVARATPHQFRRAQQNSSVSQ